jgi:predicted nucleic acid-binding protein
MIVIMDSSVLSEQLRAVPEARVLAWVDAQPAYLLFTTASTQGEMLYRVDRLPPGARADIEAIFSTDVAGRVLAYDGDAAAAHAAIATERQATVPPVSQSDAMIAGIGRVHGARLATRNVRDFEGCGIAQIDPWH